MFLEYVTLIIALYAAGLSTVQWLVGRKKKIKINYRLENTAFEENIIHKAIIFQIINFSQKPIFIKYCYILDKNNKRLLISPDSFWTANREASEKETEQLDPDRMLDIIYDRNKVFSLAGMKFVIEDESGKKFSTNFDIKKEKVKTYTVAWGKYKNKK